MKLKHFCAIAALLIAVVMMPSCGDTFRPITTSLLQPAGNPNTVNTVIGVTTANTVVPGQTVHINLSGDTVTAAVQLGFNPTSAFINPLLSSIVVSNAGAGGAGPSTLYEYFTPIASFPDANIVSLPANSTPGRIYSNNSTTYVVLKRPGPVYSVGVVDITGNFSDEIAPTATFQPTAMVGPSNGTTLYIADSKSGNVYIIDQTDNSVEPTVIPMGVTPSSSSPQDMAITSDGKYVYVMNQGSHDVTVFNTTTNAVTVTSIPVGTNPTKLVYDPKLLRIYVLNQGSNSITIINADPNATVANGSTSLFNTVIKNVPQVGTDTNPVDIIASPDGTRFYVANRGSKNVAVYDTLSNSLVTDIDVTTNTNAPNVNTSPSVYPISLAMAVDSSRLVVAVVDPDYTPTIGAVLAQPPGTEHPDGNGFISIKTATNQAVTTIHAPFTTSGAGGCVDATVMTDASTHIQTVCTRLRPLVVLQ